MTSGHKDALMSQMTILEDLTDLEATVTDTYINTLKEDSDPKTFTLSWSLASNVGCGSFGQSASLSPSADWR